MVSKSVRPMLGLSFAVFHISAAADISDPVFQGLIGTFPISHSVDETVNVSVAIDLQQNLQEPALIRYRLGLVNGDPYIVNEVENQVSITGFGNFSVRHRSDQPDGRAYIDVNGQELCCVDVVNDRMTYMVRLESGQEAQFLAGGEIPIPTSNRATVATRVFATDTGVTHSTDGIRIAIIGDDRLGDPILFSHSTVEAADLLVAVGDIPGVDNRSNVRVTHGFELHTGDGTLLGEIGVDVAVDRLGKVSILAGPGHSYGEASLMVNGQEFCCVPVDNNQIAYRVNVKRSRVGRNPLTGEAVDIPASVQSSMTGTVFDLATGTTRGTYRYRDFILRPVVKPGY